MYYLISEYQSAFIQDRQINDCIMIINEEHTTLKSKKCRGLILKIDFEKAFDSVNWEFLFEVMKSMNFEANR